MDTKFDYFIDQTNKRLESMDRKLDQLITFRAVLIAASATVSIIVSFGFKAVEVYFLK